MFENGWNSTYELSITVGRFLPPRRRSATSPSRMEASTYQLAGGRYTLVYNNYLTGNTHTAEPACTVTERCVCFVHNPPPPSPPTIPPITPSPPPDPPMIRRCHRPPLAAAAAAATGRATQPTTAAGVPAADASDVLGRDGTTTTTQAGCETTPRQRWSSCAAH